MKKILNVIAIVLILPILQISNANANETSVAMGGFAIVNPETGVVHGVIVGSIEEFGGNDKTMPNAFMGCPPGCKIILQSTADKNNNVAGIHGPTITYDNNRNVFQNTITDVTQSETIVESVSNVLVSDATNAVITPRDTETVILLTDTMTSITETKIDVNFSKRIYEFGVQNFLDNEGHFEINEVSALQNTKVEIFADTKTFFCENYETSCSYNKSYSSSNILNESILFNERLTADEVEIKIITEEKNKIKQHLAKIFIILEKWILNNN
jgi:hypothetical protein